MQIQIESTDQVTELDGVPVRVWRGVTAGGVECLVYVHRVQVRRDADCRAFEAELREQAPPAYVPAVKMRAAAVRARRLTRREAWLEVLAEPRPVRETAALMRVGVHAVKQMARKLRRAGFDVPRVRKRRAAR